ncbi:periplasmic nitrate reductase, NapE protein [Leisingera daeponensis]|uniref:Periplasmic nitrate reductase, NapE protein n=1 Tax=Leisingera daeponensis TaxID=405746 RepID=A0ABS7NJS9_9RHOB|nr:periplasmic nitrate reductase, NapE protein [Leisingera daeponensis]MBY6057552.1 periplasmic nitrate reductase, NapE protein [Leisingera daeponensis]MBY6141460.1 periplasmic nitrate reductase, NapE protein [Leisingera daeponensis]
MSEQPTKAEERNTFLFLAVVLAPVLAVAIVGGYGLMIWISQIFLGPPAG